MTLDFETLESYWSPEEAHLNKNILEAEGIQCFLQGETASTTLWHLANASGGVRLQVPRSELSRASSILQALRQYDMRIESQQELESVDYSLPLEMKDGPKLKDESTPFEHESETGEFGPENEEDSDETDQYQSAGLLQNFHSIRSLILFPFLMGPVFAVATLVFYLLCIVFVALIGV